MPTRAALECRSVEKTGAAVFFFTISNTMRPYDWRLHANIWAVASFLLVRSLDFICHLMFSHLFICT